MGDMSSSVPHVNAIVYLTKTVGPMVRGTEVIVREVTGEPAYPIVVEPNPTLSGHYFRLDMPLAPGEWSDTRVPEGSQPVVQTQGE